MTEQTETITPMDTGKAGCCDCGLLYGSPGWADVVVPDLVWDQISPTGDSGGLLCFNCMVRRLDAMDLRNVPYSIESGPFAFSIRDRQAASEQIADWEGE